MGKPWSLRFSLEHCALIGDVWKETVVYPHLPYNRASSSAVSRVPNTSSITGPKPIPTPRLVKFKWRGL